MQIATNFDIALSQYMVMLNADSVTDEIRKDVYDAVGDDNDNYITAVNLVIVTAIDRKNKGIYSTEEAIDFIETEYKGMKFGKKFCSFDYLKPLCALVLDKNSFFGDKNMVSYVKECYEKGKTCPFAPIRNGIAIYTLRVLFRFDLSMKDIGFASEVANATRALSEDDKKSAIIPPCFIQEI